jgi:hypothetical protein
MPVPVIIRMGVTRRKCETSAQPGKQQYQAQDRENTQIFPIGTQKADSQDVTLAVSVERRNQVINALWGNRVRIYL